MRYGLSYVEKRKLKFALQVAQVVDLWEHLFYNGGMDTLIKLQEIAVHMALEPAEEVGAGGRTPGEGRDAKAGRATVAPCGQVIGPPPAGTPGERAGAPRNAAAGKAASLGVTHVQLPNGRTMPLLKTMMTTACERNCHYCPFRAGRSRTRRVTFSADEMAMAFMDMRRAGAVDGLFLSSGIIGGGVRSQDKMLDTADIIRRDYGFTGYIHLKIMPGSERDQVYRAMQLADRLSINLEAPTPERLSALATAQSTSCRHVRSLRSDEAGALERQGAAILSVATWAKG